MATSGQIRDDYRHISEEESQISGNVFDNDGRLGVNAPGPHEDFRVIPGTLESQHSGDDTDGVGKYGTLTINEDGSYVYTITDVAGVNAFGEGVDYTEEFKYIEEWYENDGTKRETEKTIKITIHGENDQPLITDVQVNAFEGGDHAGDVEIYAGQLTLGDADPATPGQQDDLDQGDQNDFQQVGNVTVTSADVDDALLTGVDVTVNADGTYSVTGDFDALSVGDTATVTFQYNVIDTSTSGATTPSDPKTVTLTVVGQNDSVEIRDDLIITYDELIDGDIYKSILANDGHYDPMGSTTLAKDIDVNDTLTIASTGFHDLQFYQEGGSISVDNAARVLQYTPGSGGAIAKDHFDFYYQATDGHTDPIGSALAEFAMVNKNDEEIDWYQFGGNGNDTLNGIKGATNVLSGMAGDDYIEGKEKGDILYGGSGDDEMQGGWGNDIYKGGTGNDGIVDTRGADFYVFSKGDGRDTIDDTDLEIYQDAMGHDDINLRNFSNIMYAAEIVGAEIDDVDHSGMADLDVVHFDESVDKSEIAFFQEQGQYGSLLIKYSENANDKVSIGWQEEEHYGVEKIEAADGTHIYTKGNLEQFDSDLDGNIDMTFEQLVQYIATYDLDGDATNGVQAAQNVQDVQNNEHLMNVIATGWA